ncbi:unnamed protein product [Caenorhabditis sp. 36 PRJEB53466]|nr:unnamed protein product [Caenorhabditis sp. 36 PRJEB53466]
MSLLQHLRLYHGNWMLKKAELNELFAGRPKLLFTVYPLGNVINGRPMIANTLVKDTLTCFPGTEDAVSLVEFYKQIFHYRILFPNDLAIYFDTNPYKFYPAELIYVDEIEACRDFLSNPFTIVV